MPFHTRHHPTSRDARSPIERALEWSAVLPLAQALVWVSVLWLITIVLDGVTGRLVSLSAVYLLPLCLTTWCFGRWWGLLAGVAAVGITLTINGFGDGLSAQASHVPVAIAVWNATMRVTAVAFLILLVSAFRRTFDRERLHARIDPLTGLGNRRAFAIESRKLELTAVRDHRIMLCGLIDLDDFKSINDKHGHAVGDQILQTAARALNMAVRPYDATARIGGDELAFCLIVPDTESAKRKAAFIYQQVSSALAEAVVPSTCSLGATASLHLDSALEYADRAMYSVKEQGKSAWQFIVN